MAYYDITGVKLNDLIQAAYELSVPRGLGFLHAEPGPLSGIEIDEIRTRQRDQINLDYVKGRCVKFNTIHQGSPIYISDRWFDHRPDDLTELLTRVGMKDAPLIDELPEI